MNTTTQTNGHTRKSRNSGTTVVVKQATKTQQPDEVEMYRMVTVGNRSGG